MATEEMRNDFDELTASLQRPKDFRLKVRNHHGLMTITSLAKMNFTENIEISFSGTNPQTYQLLRNKFAIENNFDALKNLVASIGLPEKPNRIERRGKIKYLFYPNQSIDSICDFIDVFKIEQPSIKNATLSEYIKSQENKINEWSICIVSNTDERVFIDHKGGTPKDQRKANEDVSTFELQYKGETISFACTVR